MRLLNKHIHPLSLLSLLSLLSFGSWITGNKLWNSFMFFIIFILFNHRKGDERTHNNILRAAFLSFIVIIFMLVVLGLLFDRNIIHGNVIIFLPPIILFSIFVFGILNIVFEKIGR